MPSDQSSDDRGGSVLSGLLAPLRLPERAMQALDSLADAAKNLGPMRSELTRVREQTEPLAEVMPILEGVRDRIEPVGDLMPAVESVRAQTEPLAELMPLLETIRKQTEPLGELMPVLESIREQTEPLAKLMPALADLEEGIETRLDSLFKIIEALESDESHLNATVRELISGLAAIYKAVSQLQGDVERVTDRLPDPKSGPLDKAKEVLTGNSD